MGARGVVANGSIVVVWASAEGQDGECCGIFARRFNPDGTKKYK